MKKFLLLIIVLLFAACTSGDYQVAAIRIKGSDTMLQLTENLAREYMRENPGISIYVEGGGTSSGVNSLIKNEVDIATASRSLKSKSIGGILRLTWNVLPYCKRCSEYIHQQR
jgi:phosphate transport system substrate-binding protein